MPLGLLLPLITPILTEVVKWVVESVMSKIPHSALPVVSAALGAASTAIAPHLGVDLGVSPLEGGVLGLAGTGVHQFQKLLRQTEK